MNRIRKLNKDNPIKKEMEQLTNNINSFDDAVSELVKRFGFYKEGGIDCKSQLEIFAIIDGLKKLTKWD